MRPRNLGRGATGPRLPKPRGPAEKPPDPRPISWKPGRIQPAPDRARELSARIAPDAGRIGRGSVQLAPVPVRSQMGWAALYALPRPRRHGSPSGPLTQRPHG